MIQKLEGNPSSPEAPWNLILYSDEVVPGVALSNHNRRKVWVIYLSFLEFGPITLQNEHAWLPILAYRSMEMKTNISSGISQMFAILLKLIFCGAHSLLYSGVVLEHNNQLRRLFAKLGMFLQDGGAHKLVFNCKGDAGTRFCMECRNLVATETRLATDAGAWLFKCSLIHEHDMDFATDDDVKGSVARLAMDFGILNNGMFKLKEQAIGFKHEPHGLLLDQELLDIVHPISQFCHDWMHGMLVHGVFNTVLLLLLNAAHVAGARTIWTQLERYLSTWSWPKRIGSTSHLGELFGAGKPKKSNDAGYFKCSASQALTMYAVIGFWVQTVLVPAGIAVPACLAFLAMCDVLDMLQATALGIISHEALFLQVRAFLTLALAAGWKNWMGPKWHWLIHVRRHLHRWGCLLSCFTHERKHKLVKRYATAIENTIVYEKSILSETLSHTLAQLARPGVFLTSAHLVDPVKASIKVQVFLTHELQIQINPDDCWCSFEAKLSPAGSCCKKDVVFIKPADGEAAYVAGEVWLHCETESVTMTLVSLWDLIRIDAGTHCAYWHKKDQPTLVHTEDIIAAVISCNLRYSVRTLIPYQLRK